VRNLEREMAKICRKVVKDPPARRRIGAQEGPGHTQEPGEVPGRAALPLRPRRGNDQVGQVTGLAWTEVGGELLTIEAA
jgi:ATP-dependent Lon protease